MRVRMRFCILRKQKTVSGNVSGLSGLRWQALRTGTEKLSATPAMPRKLWLRSIWCLAILSSFAMFSPVATAGSTTRSRIVSSPQRVGKRLDLPCDSLCLAVRAVRELNREGPHRLG